ncbi:unnamed protein product (macronuclear) [Paramecium tetraurelia]|uniref:RRM domain-containing protein n=1 Tax=Paramecium tetraurelia TaxID=5888 RepID=A0E1G3_PARTE|nr:uncharacterized protein GSPATT00022299001 [Paramecium tetraurelia]CAK89130.1 unnamed protein product [Paramecium tetraurelia]|eukprot:XP_001456527.1 hypothetical protein (macronuclear) [Paramecium tetraurelia strain d4-2]
MIPRDPPSKILLLIITYLPQSFSLTNDFLFETFKQYGEVKKILIFERGKTNKAFVEYNEVKHAISARRNMIGKSLTPQGGRLLIHYSRLKQLDLEVVDHTRGSEYHSDDEETQPEQKSPLKSMTLPNSIPVSLPLIKPHSLEEQPNNGNPFNGIQNITEESPTKAMQNDSSIFSRMETQLRQLERILDDDYEQEVAKIQLTQLDPNEQAIQELLNQQPSKFLRVSNLDERVTPRMLYNLFNRFGHLEALLLKRNIRQSILQFVNKENAIIAKELLNNVVFFGNELRILFQTASNALLQPNNPYDEYYQGSQTKFKIVPLSRVLSFSGITQLLEIQDMVKLVGKIQEIKLDSQNIQITMVDIYEALKVISVFSEYDYKGNKISLTLK